MQLAHRACTPFPPDPQTRMPHFVNGAAFSHREHRVELLPLGDRLGDLVAVDIVLARPTPILSRPAHAWHLRFCRPRVFLIAFTTSKFD
eukprot:3313492-Pleurochrysis_carterae.AAC.1